MWWNCVSANWNESWHIDENIKRVRCDKCDFIHFLHLHFILLFYFILLYNPASQQKSVYAPILFSVICLLTPSKLATVLESAQANTHSFTYLPSHSHQPVYWFLSAFSHCSGKVKTEWLIPLWPLFSSCTGGIHWDWCPSDHLCTAQERGVLGSESGAQQLSALFLTISELGFCFTRISFLAHHPQQLYFPVESILFPCRIRWCMDCKHNAHRECTENIKCWTCQMCNSFIIT